MGSVIRNHEIQELVPSLLAAICDPNNATRPCLDTLLSTVFINTIDAPSLALIVPVVHRGLRDRSGDTKKRAARIVGSMCTLINDPKVSHGSRGSGLMHSNLHDDGPCKRSCCCWSRYKVPLPAMHAGCLMKCNWRTSSELAADLWQVTLLPSDRLLATAAVLMFSLLLAPAPPQDMTPYVPLLMPELQKALVDPLPEVRATAARAMGSLMQGMGASTFSDLLPWLLAALRSEGSSVERSGAAQVCVGSSRALN